MVNRGIAGKVAIVGVEATKFGEFYDLNQYDLLHNAVMGALKDARMQKDDIDAAWVGINFFMTGLSGSMLSDAVRMDGIPMTRVENQCSTGMDAFRNASFAVASGAIDIALACGVEKLMDGGTKGLPALDQIGHSVYTMPSSPAQFALAANRCFKEYGWTKEDLARVAVKNHANGAKHPKAHFQMEVTMEKVMTAPMMADPLGRLDCCAMSDGAAAVIITTPELAASYAHADDYIIVKANTLANFTMAPWWYIDEPFTRFRASITAAERAYKLAGIDNPRKQIDFAEVHDCFTITELINVEDLQFCGRGQAATELKNGTFNADGELPINPSGGLKSFGHPIGATGLRMLQELTKQLQGRADGIQVKDAKIGLAHNLGGPFANCAITILEQGH